MTTNQDTPQDRHRYRDARLSAALKAHRVAVKGNPDAQRTLAALESRLRYVDKCLSLWDQHHGRLAAAALDRGEMEKAAGLAWLIWDADDRLRVLSMVRMDSAAAAAAAAERLAANAELGRETVEEVAA